MLINLLIPDELKRSYNSFDACLANDGYYVVTLVNYQTLQVEDVRIPKHIVKSCDLSINLMQIDDSDYHLIEVIK